MEEESRSKRKVVEVYCDGSVSRATMKNPLTGVYSSDYIGRVAVVAPSFNYGLIERFYDSLTLANGKENSLHAEIRAIKTAEEVCKQWGEINRTAIYSDNLDAIKISESQVAMYIEPREFHFADAYLKKMLARSGYLRRSERNVSQRKPPNPRQVEIAHLMKAERIEFRLSESPLYQIFKSLAHE